MARNRRRNPPPAPVRDAEAVEASRTLVAVRSAWAGPLPSPEDLGRYDNVVPGGAERIMREWEAEAAHRRSFEARALRIEGWERIGGRVAGLVFALAAVGATVYCATIGAPWVAGILGGGTLTAVAIALIVGRKA